MIVRDYNDHWWCGVIIRRLSLMLKSMINDVKSMTMVLDRGKKNLARNGNIYHGRKRKRFARGDGHYDTCSTTV